ncbi:MAG: hypothetical protein ACK5QH_11395 [Rubrivivax sp.]
MNQLSIRTLMLSIGALARERAGLLKQLATLSPEQDSSEHCSERVLDIDQALDELADAYEDLRGGSQTYPPFKQLAGLG